MGRINVTFTIFEGPSGPNITRRYTVTKVKIASAANDCIKNKAKSKQRDSNHCTAKHSLID